MAGLQRSVVSFRRQGSSGLVWEDQSISEVLNNAAPAPDDQGAAQSTPPTEVKSPITIPPIKTVDRSRSNRGGGRGFRAKNTVSPAIEPPSPRMSACGCCSAFAKPSAMDQRAKPGKRRSM